MDRIRGDVRSPQPPRDPVRLVLRLGEHEYAFDPFGLEQGDEEPVLLLLRDHEEPLVHRIDGRRLGSRLDGHGIVQQFDRQRSNAVGDRGGEQHGLSIAGGESHDVLDVVDEAHVEHAVRFVEHQHLDLPEIDVTLVMEILEATGGRDQDIHAPLERTDLVVLVHAAVDHAVAELEVASVVDEAFVDLRRKFTGGTQDQRPWGTGPGPLVVPFVPDRLLSLRGRKTLQDRECEGAGLSGAGLGGAEDVASLQRRGDRSGLDRGGGGVALFRDRADDGLCKLQC